MMDPVPALSAVDGAPVRRQLRLSSKTAPLRKAVLETLERADNPLSAYEILNRVSNPGRRRLAPTSIYRVLEHLIADGHVARLESRNAFVRITANNPACLVYCICEQCGSAQSMEDEASSRLVDGNATLLGIRVRRRVLELQGVCARCLSCTTAASPSRRRSPPGQVTE